MLGGWLQAAGYRLQAAGYRLWTLWIKGIRLSEEEEGSDDTFKCYLLSWQVSEAGFPGDAATHTHTRMQRAEAKIATVPCHGGWKRDKTTKTNRKKKEKGKKTKQTHKTTSQNKE